MASLSDIHEKLRKLEKRARATIHTHEINEIVFSSDKISSQIPRSYAANSFNHLRSALIMHEIIQIISLWDSYKTEYDYGIRGILGDMNEVTYREVEDFTFEQRTSGNTTYSFVGNMSEEEKNAWIKKWEDDDINEAIADAEKAPTSLKGLLAKSEKIFKTRDFQSLNNMRVQIAHAASQSSKLEKSDADNLPEVDFHLITKTLNQTINVINEMSYLLLLESGSLNVKEMYKECAENLLHNCTFNITQNGGGGGD